MGSSGAVTRESKATMLSDFLTGYKPALDCGALQSASASSNTFGMSWSGMCDPEANIQHQYLTSLKVEWNSIVTEMLQHRVHCKNKNLDKVIMYLVYIS